MQCGFLGMILLVTISSLWLPNFILLLTEFQFYLSSSTCSACLSEKKVVRPNESEVQFCQLEIFSSHTVRYAPTFDSLFIQYHKIPCRSCWFEFNIYLLISVPILDYCLCHHDYVNWKKGWIIKLTTSDFQSYFEKLLTEVWATSKFIFGGNGPSAVASDFII